MHHGGTEAVIPKTATVSCPAQLPSGSFSLDGESAKTLPLVALFRRHGMLSAQFANNFVTDLVGIAVPL
jgi:hypothetical protein